MPDDPGRRRRRKVRGRPSHRSSGDAERDVAPDVRSQGADLVDSKKAFGCGSRWLPSGMIQQVRSAFETSRSPKSVFGPDHLGNLPLRSRTWSHPGGFTTAPPTAS
jgi:hypothetical protein